MSYTTERFIDMLQRKANEQKAGVEFMFRQMMVIAKRTTGRARYWKRYRFIGARRAR